jgi:predicted HAD superfamily Cof-like phosphohydrolase
MPRVFPGVADMVAEFHAVKGLEEPFGGGRQSNIDRAKMHNSENIELMDALAEDNREHIAQELADVVYVAYGTAHSKGIPLDAVIAAVHQANMRKRFPDGSFRLNDDGKVTKPPGWQGPNVAAALERDPRALGDRGHRHTCVRPAAHLHDDDRDHGTCRNERHWLPALIAEGDVHSAAAGWAPPLPDPLG